MTWADEQAPQLIFTMSIEVDTHKFLIFIILVKYLSYITYTVSLCSARTISVKSKGKENIMKEKLESKMGKVTFS